MTPAGHVRVIVRDPIGNVIVDTVGPLALGGTFPFEVDLEATSVEVDLRQPGMIGGAIVGTIEIREGVPS